MRDGKAQDRVVIATKVSPEVARLFREIAARIGVSMYRLFEMMIHSIVKYADETHRLDPTLQKAVEIFEGFDNWAAASSLTNAGRCDVSKAVYVAGERDFVLYFFREMEKRGEFAVMVDADKYPENATYNVVDIFQDFITALFPRLVRGMDMLCRARSTEKYYHMFLEMIQDELAALESEEENIGEMFADNERADNGRSVADVRKYVAHNNRNPLTASVHLAIGLGEKDDE